MTTLENRPNTAVLVIDVQNGIMGDAYERDTVVALTYGVVVFSIFAQGLSIGYVTRKSVTQPARLCRGRAARL